jgi:hypothetical protein
MLNGTAKLSDEQRPPLEALVPHPNGCAEAELLAGGFSVAQLSGLVIDGYASLQRKRVDINGRQKTVLWMQITKAGRAAIAIEANTELALITATARHKEKKP